MQLLPNLSGYQIILASNSPRRKELFATLDIDFETFIKDVDETYPQYLTGVDIPIFLAKKKADAYIDIIKDKTIIITADTIVWHEGRVFNKPTNRDNAFSMLKSLSGKTHQVITGVCIYSQSKKKCFHVISEVRFSVINDMEINYYLDKFQPYDKAGAYGVQEWIGYVGVEHIEGSYYNVMGLPIQRLYSELKKW